MLEIFAQTWKVIQSFNSHTPVERYSELHRQDNNEAHWAYYYARKLLTRHGRDVPITIQTSMSPTGYFHIGNFRDTFCAYMVLRAINKLGGKGCILLSFDDYDAFRQGALLLTDEIADPGGFPLGAARKHAALICQTYIRELQQLGICPANIGENDTTHNINSVWTIHYQYERYTAGTYNHRVRQYLRNARLLARLLGVDDAKKLFVLYCRQCGRSQTTVLRISTRCIHYFCKYCHALTSTSDFHTIKPSWALEWSLRIIHERIHCEPAGPDHCSAGSTMDRTKKIYSQYFQCQQPVIVPYGLVRQFDQQAKISGSRGNGLRITDLLACFPPFMILWLYGRRNCLSDIRVSLTANQVFSSYDEHDRFLSTVNQVPRGQALYQLLTDLPLPTSSLRLPSFRYVVGLLQAYCYHSEQVLNHLRKQGYTDSPVCTLQQRVMCARGWLTGHGQHHNWFIQCEIDDRMDHELLTRTPSIADWSTFLRGTLQREDYILLYGILFKTSSGPRLARLVQIFSEEQIIHAIHCFLQDQYRPLRKVILQHLITEGA